MNRVVCELVNSTQSNPKIIVHGYLLVKDKNRNEKHYWCCEYRKKLNCNGRAVTILEREQHILVKSSEHSHAPEANRVDVIRTVNMVKETAASQTRDKPSQIIQNAVINMPQESYSYMPNREALRRQVSRVRNINMPPQPKSLQDIDVPANLCVTLGGEEFLTKDITLGEERIMIFCTTSNLEYLQKADFWVMDGTFRTVPTLFHQMYTVHALVGGESNSRVLPMVYILMTSRSKVIYERIFQELTDLAEEAGQMLAPPMIITDFEQAAINAAQVEFPGSVHKGCFFHLCQSFWRKIQSLGLASEYGNSEEFSIKLRHMTALAFLPSSEIPHAFDQIKSLMPPNASQIVQYFEETYVNGKIRRQMPRSGTVIRNPPLFPPELWSVHELIENGYPRTQNMVEGWHQRWSTIIGRSHIGLYSIIDEMRKEQCQTELQIESILRGEARPYQRKHIVERENRLLTIFNGRDDYSLLDYLRGIAHTISL
ncbi:unnamed protein product [Rhizophagus irregularis]|nr:unnamed protein product [Rhizophagus irregularis]CAB4420444.1 unnamed protein product [Rhizophagus irregularis]CAB4420452.1 unnamed protein product [Rhizophagus irregularis]